MKDDVSQHKYCKETCALLTQQIFTKSLGVASFYYTFGNNKEKLKEN